jgi:hypothetical protein
MDATDGRGLKAHARNATTTHSELKPVNTPLFHRHPQQLSQHTVSVVFASIKPIIIGELSTKSIVARSGGIAFGRLRCAKLADTIIFHLHVYFKLQIRPMERMQKMCPRVHWS